MKTRLSYHMAAIILAVVDRRQAADNFLRTPLAVLASKGMIDIVGGMCEITSFGYACLPQAEKVMRQHEIKEQAKWAHPAGCACDACIANQIPKHPW